MLLGAHNFPFLLYLTSCPSLSFVQAVAQDTTGTELDVVLNGAIRNPSMTDWRYVTAYNGWVVSTRVPSTRMPNGNKFSFQSGESITVYGTVELKLFTENRRKLKLFADNVIITVIITTLII